MTWKYETCKLCHRRQRLAWSVSDEVWEQVVYIRYYKDKTLCLECFFDLASDRGAALTLKDITFHGIILEKA